MSLNLDEFAGILGWRLDEGDDGAARRRTIHKYPAAGSADGPVVR